MNSLDQEPLVLILMGTFNGERFIREQLDSIAAQTHKNWKLVISDDGSTDKTLDIAKQWAKEVGDERVEFREGPRQGFAQNFLSMACDPNLRADFYAFCDQDDILIKEKITASVHLAQEHETVISACEITQQTSPADRLFLYCGRTAYIKGGLSIYQYSRHYKKSPSFANAIVQCLAGGNTMLFNTELKNLIGNIGVLPVASHDWWLYQVVAGARGHIHYDLQHYVLYRQSENSLVGENRSLGANMKRLRAALSGTLKKNIDKNINCWEKAREYLDPANRTLLENFTKRQNGRFFERIRNIKSLGIYRQSLVQTLALYFFFNN